MNEIPADHLYVIALFLTPVETLRLCSVSRGLHRVIHGVMPRLLPTIAQPLSELAIRHNNVTRFMQFVSYIRAITWNQRFHGWKRRDILMVNAWFRSQPMLTRAELCRCEYFDLSPITTLPTLRVLKAEHCNIRALRHGLEELHMGTDVKCLCMVPRSVRVLTECYDTKYLDSQVQLYVESFVTSDSGVSWFVISPRLCSVIVRCDSARSLVYHKHIDNAFDDTAPNGNASNNSRITYPFEIQLYRDNEPVLFINRGPIARYEILPRRRWLRGYKAKRYRKTRIDLQ